MQEKIVLFGGGDGIGGLLSTFQCAYFVKQAKIFHEVDVSIRQDSGEVLKYLFDDQFNLRIQPEEYSHNHKIIFDKNLRESIFPETKDENFYYICPDLLHRNPFGFDFRRFNVNLQTLKSTRLLTHRFKPENIIYLGLISSTPGYSYANVRRLIFELSARFKNYTIYCPILDSWAGKDICVLDTRAALPSNVIIDKNPNFVESIKWLEKSELVFCLDNGISHISYHLGNARIFLDPYSQIHQNNCAMHVRWRETLEDSVSMDFAPEYLADLARTIIDTPQTMLINKSFVINNLQYDFSRLMNFKY